MGIQLLWTAVAIYLVAQAFAFPAANVVVAVLAIIGCAAMWMGR